VVAGVSDLIPRLLAAIDEREAKARAAAEETEADWVIDPDDPHSNAIIGGSTRDIVVYDEGRPMVGEAAHIAANDPASVLRMCQAHRKIVDAFVGVRSDPARRTDVALHLSFNLLRQVVTTLAEGYDLTTGGES